MDSSLARLLIACVLAAGFSAPAVATFDASKFTDVYSVSTCNELISKTSGNNNGFDGYAEGYYNQALNITADLNCVNETLKQIMNDDGNLGSPNFNPAGLIEGNGHTISNIVDTNNNPAFAMSAHNLTIRNLTIKDSHAGGTSGTNGAGLLFGYGCGVNVTNVRTINVTITTGKFGGGVFFRDSSCDDTPTTFYNDNTFRRTYADDVTVMKNTSYDAGTNNQHHDVGIFTGTSSSSIGVHVINSFVVNSYVHTLADGDGSTDNVQADACAITCSSPGDGHNIYVSNNTVLDLATNQSSGDTTTNETFGIPDDGNGGLYYNNDTERSPVTATSATALNTSEMQKQSSFPEYDFTDTWEIKEGVNYGYPVHQYWNIPQPDITPPNLTVNPSTHTGPFRNKSYIFINVTAVDNTALSTVEETFAATTSGLTNQTGNPFYTSNHTGLSDGNYTFSMSADDSKGNTNNSDTFEVQIDTTTPTIHEFNVTNPTFTDVNITVNTSETVDTLNVTFDNTIYTKQEFAYTGDVYYNNISSYTEGDFNATLNSAIDPAGNNGAAGETSNVSVHNDPPTATSLGPDDGTSAVNDTNDGTGIDVNITATLSDPQGNAIDADLYVNGTLKNTWTGLSSPSFITYMVQNLETGTTYDWYIATSDTDETGNTATRQFTTVYNRTTTTTTFGEYQNSNKTSTTTTQFIYRVKQITNVGNALVEWDLLDPPSVTGSCSDCNARNITDINVDESINQSFHASMDKISETTTNFDNPTGKVYYGSGVTDNYTTMETINLTSSYGNSLSVDVARSASGISGCGATNGTGITVPGNGFNKVSVQVECNPGIEINNTLNSTDIGNSTKYTYTAHFTTKSGKTGGLPNGLVAETSRLTDFGGRNTTDVMLNVSIDNSQSSSYLNTTDTLSVSAASKTYAVLTASTGLASGDHKAVLNYTVPDSYGSSSSGGGSGGGGGGGGGSSGSSESPTPVSGSIDAQLTAGRIVISNGGGRGTLRLQNFLTEPNKITVTIPDTGGCQYFTVAAPGSNQFTKQATYTVSKGDQSGPGTRTPKVNASIPDGVDTPVTCEATVKGETGTTATVTLEAGPPQGLLGLLIPGQPLSVFSGKGGGSPAPSFTTKGASATPGDLTYGFDRFLEIFDVLLAGLGSDEATARTHYQLAEERLAEYERAAKRGNANRARNVLEQYVTQIQKARALANKSGNTDLLNKTRSVKDDIQVIRTASTEIKAAVDVQSTVKAVKP